MCRGFEDSSPVGVERLLVRGMTDGGWGRGGRGKEGVYFDFEEVFGRAVDFFEALLASIGHCLHGGGLVLCLDRDT